MFLQNKTKGVQIKTADYGLNEELNSKVSRASFGAQERAPLPQPPSYVSQSSNYPANQSDFGDPTMNRSLLWSHASKHRQDKQYHRNSLKITENHSQVENQQESLLKKPQREEECSSYADNPNSVIQLSKIREQSNPTPQTAQHKTRRRKRENDKQDDGDQLYYDVTMKQSNPHDKGAEHLFDYDHVNFGQQMMRNQMDLLFDHHGAGRNAQLYNSMERTFTVQPSTQQRGASRDPNEASPTNMSGIDGDQETRQLNDASQRSHNNQLDQPKMPGRVSDEFGGATISQVAGSNMPFKVLKLENKAKQAVFSNQNIASIGNEEGLDKGEQAKQYLALIEEKMNMKGQPPSPDQQEMNKLLKTSDKKLSKTEIQNWRKLPTMKVMDMVDNLDKAKAENVYIAQAKFKYHLQGEMSFEEIRWNLNNTYGGFTKDGRYYHKPGTFDQNRQAHQQAKDRHLEAQSKQAQLDQSPHNRSMIKQLVQQQPMKRRRKKIVNSLQITTCRMGSQGSSPKQKASQGRLKAKESSKEPAAFNSNIVVKNMNISEMLNKYKLKSKILQQRGNPRSRHDSRDKNEYGSSHQLAPVATNENNETSRYSFIQSTQEDNKMTQLYGGNSQNHDRSKHSSNDNSYAGRSPSQMQIDNQSHEQRVKNLQDQIRMYQIDGQMQKNLDQLRVLQGRGRRTRKPEHGSQSSSHHFRDDLIAQPNQLSAAVDSSTAFNQRMQHQRYSSQPLSAQASNNQTTIKDEQIINTIPSQDQQVQILVIQNNQESTPSRSQGTTVNQTAMNAQAAPLAALKLLPKNVPHAYSPQIQNALLKQQELSTRTVKQRQQLFISSQDQDTPSRKSIRIGIVKINNESQINNRDGTSMVNRQGGMPPHTSLGIYPNGQCNVNSNQMLEDGLRHFAMLDQRINTRMKNQNQGLYNSSAYAKPPQNSHEGQRKSAIKLSTQQNMHSSQQNFKTTEMGGSTMRPGPMMGLEGTQVGYMTQMMNAQSLKYYNPQVKTVNRSQMLSGELQAMSPSARYIDQLSPWLDCKISQNQVQQYQLPKQEGIARQLRTREEIQITQQNKNHDKTAESRQIFLNAQSTQQPRQQRASFDERIVGSGNHNNHRRNIIQIVSAFDENAHGQQDSERMRSQRDSKNQLKDSIAGTYRGSQPEDHKDASGPQQQSGAHALQTHVTHRSIRKPTDWRSNSHQSNQTPRKDSSEHKEVNQQEELSASNQKGAKEKSTVDGRDFTYWQLQPIKNIEPKIKTNSELASNQSIQEDLNQKDKTREAARNHVLNHTTFNDDDQSESNTKPIQPNQRHQHHGVSQSVHVSKREKNSQSMAKPIGDESNDSPDQSQSMMRGSFRASALEESTANDYVGQQNSQISFLKNHQRSTTFKLLPKTQANKSIHYKQIVQTVINRKRPDAYHKLLSDTFHLEKIEEKDVARRQHKKTHRLSKMESKEVKTNLDLSLEVPSDVFSAKMFNESMKASEDQKYEYNLDQDVLQSQGEIDINASNSKEITIKDESTSPINIRESESGHRLQTFALRESAKKQNEDGNLATINTQTKVHSINTQEQEYLDSAGPKVQKLEEKTQSQDQIKEYQIMERILQDKIESRGSNSPINADENQADTITKPQINTSESFREEQALQNKVHQFHLQKSESPGFYINPNQEQMAIHQKPQFMTKIQIENMEKPNQSYQDKTQTLNIDNSNMNLNNAGVSNNNSEHRADVSKNEMDKTPRKNGKEGNYTSASLYRKRKNGAPDQRPRLDHLESADFGRLPPEIQSNSLAGSSQMQNQEGILLHKVNDQVNHAELNQQQKGQQDHYFSPKIAVEDDKTKAMSIQGNQDLIFQKIRNLTTIHEVQQMRQDLLSIQDQLMRSTTNHISYGQSLQNQINTQDNASSNQSRQSKSVMMNRKEAEGLGPRNGSTGNQIVNQSNEYVISDNLRSQGAVERSKGGGNSLIGKIKNDDYDADQADKSKDERSGQLNIQNFSLATSMQAQQHSKNPAENPRPKKLQNPPQVVEAGTVSDQQASDKDEQTPVAHRAIYKGLNLQVGDDEEVGHYAPTIALGNMEVQRSQAGTIASNMNRSMNASTKWAGPAGDKKQEWMDKSNEEQSDRSLLLKMDYMTQLSQNLELLQQKEQEILSKMEEKKSISEKQYVDANMKKLNEQLQAMVQTKEELKVQEFKFMEPLLQNNNRCASKESQRGLSSQYTSGSQNDYRYDHRKGGVFRGPSVRFGQSRGSLPAMSIIQAQRLMKLSAQKQFESRERSIHKHANSMSRSPQRFVSVHQSPQIYDPTQKRAADPQENTSRSSIDNYSPMRAYREEPTAAPNSQQIVQAASPLPQYSNLQPNPEEQGDYPDISNLEAGVIARSADLFGSQLPRPAALALERYAEPNNQADNSLTIIDRRRREINVKDPLSQSYRAQGISESSRNGLLPQTKLSSVLGYKKEKSCFAEPPVVDSPSPKLPEVDGPKQAV